MRETQTTTVIAGCRDWRAEADVVVAGKALKDAGRALVCSGAVLASAVDQQ